MLYKMFLRGEKIRPSFLFAMYILVLPKVNMERTKFYFSHINGQS